MFPQFDPSARTPSCSPGAWPPRPVPPSAGSVFDSPTAEAWAERGEAGRAGPPGDQPRRPGGHDRRGRHPHRPRRQDLARRRGRPRHGQDLRLRRRGAGRRRRQRRTFRIGKIVVNEGDVLSIDGSTGEVFLGAVAVVPSPVETYIEEGLEAALDGADEETAELVRAVDRLLTHADGVRRLAVRANADTAEDAARARRLGAQGIGLCRTEHMFLGDRRVADRAGHPGRQRRRARGGAGGAAAAAARRTSSSCSSAMDGLPVEHPAARPAAARVPARPHRAGGEGGPRRGQRGKPDPKDVTAARRGRAAARDEPDARAARRAARVCWSRACSPCRCGRSPRPSAPSSKAGRRPAGRDHGAAGRLGDGAAPDPRREPTAILAEVAERAGVDARRSRSAP